MSSTPQNAKFKDLTPDEYIRRYFELGCEVKGLCRGHVKRIKDTVKGK